MKINGYEIVYDFGNGNASSINFYDAGWLSWFIKKSSSYSGFRLPTKNEMISILKGYGGRNPKYCCHWWTSTPDANEPAKIVNIKFDGNNPIEPEVYIAGKDYECNVWLVKKVASTPQKSNTTGTKSSTSPPKPSASSTGVKKPIAPTKK